MSEGSNNHYNKQKITTQNDLKQTFTSTDIDCWSPERIKHSLSERGFTLVSLARHHGLSESTFRICLRKRWHEAEVLLASTMRILSSEEKRLRVWRFISFTTRSASSVNRSFLRLIISSLIAMMSQNHSLRQLYQSVH